ncbi:hypothetical protein [Prochlorococcus sp. MIT 1307]|uniref:hypothetical protein n=1 Tax=Prochlorococcus sp. MIT 1307 TaxID=3096219 RepID=UPI002A75FD52|nr:hypothetical protein [Prochlorococcus sp. MIT 1307]
MADDPIDKLRLSLMQDVLPIGMAMVERARQGGPSKVAEVFTASDAPLADLKIEGEPAAKILREQLDQVSPGLGNPVVPVKVAIEVTTNPQNEQTLDQESLMQFLDMIEDDMNELEQCLFEDCSDTKNLTSE